MITLFPDRNPRDFDRWTHLLHSEGIRPEKTVDAVYGLEDEGTLIATASCYQNIIKCVAVAETYRGGAIFNELLSGVMTELFQKGYPHLFVYTKPSAERSFTGLGFQAVERVGEELVFMERPHSHFTDYLESLKLESVKKMESLKGEIPKEGILQEIPKEKSPKEGTRKKKPPISAGFRSAMPIGSVPRSTMPIGAIVLNANPFTKGHLALIETAARQCSLLHLFVVSENVSVFPTAVRKRLVAEGTAHLKRLILHETDSYLVSAATFPSYFLKEESPITEIQAALDARLFRFHIARALNISVRFVGEEPFSPTTAAYNEAMCKTFASPADSAPPIDLQIMPRVRCDGAPIAASTVRHLLAAGNLDSVEKMVPPTTMRFLRSPAAAPILEALKSDPLQGEKPSDHHADMNRNGKK